MWEKTKYGAALCRSTDRVNAADPFRGYLAGMLPSIGLISVLRVLDLEDDALSQPKSGAFCLLAGRQASNLSARIARLWDMPQAVAEAARALSEADGKLPGHDLGYALYIADQLGKLRVMINARHLPDEYDSILDGLNAQTATQYREFAYIAY